MKHCFKIALAKEFGIEEAILIDEFQFQISGKRSALGDLDVAPRGGVDLHRRA